MSTPLSAPEPLTPAEVAALLRASADALATELAGAPRRVVTWHAAPGEWCLLETLGHLIEAERRGFSGRILTILEQDEPTFQSWDQATVARERRDCRREPSHRRSRAATGIATRRSSSRPTCSRSHRDCRRIR